MLRLLTPTAARVRRVTMTEARKNPLYQNRYGQPDPGFYLVIDDEIEDVVDTVGPFDTLPEAVSYKVEYA